MGDEGFQCLLDVTLLVDRVHPGVARCLAHGEDGESVPAVSLAVVVNVLDGPRFFWLRDDIHLNVLATLEVLVRLDLLITLGVRFLVETPGRAALAPELRRKDLFPAHVCAEIGPAVV